MKKLRIELIKILANMADEPSQTFDRLEWYIRKREKDAVKKYIQLVKNF